MADWRECEFAGNWIYGNVARKCNVTGYSQIVKHKDCAGCDMIEWKRKADLWDKHVPALVETVKASEAYIARVCQKCPNPVSSEIHARVCQDCGGIDTLKAARAALALLPQAPAAGSRDSRGDTT